MKYIKWKMIISQRALNLIFVKYIIEIFNEFGINYCFFVFSLICKLIRFGKR